MNVAWKLTLMNQEASSSDISLEERLASWRQEQYAIASQVIIREDPPCWKDTERFKCIPLDDEMTTLFGGVDVSFPSHEEHASVAVYVVLDSKTNEIVYQDYEYFHLCVPYVSSYLSFREIEPLTRLITKQQLQAPQVLPRAILVDGNGILHARYAGIACFVGVRTKIPTIGVGKSLYYQGGLTRELVDAGLNASLKAMTDAVDEWSTLSTNSKVLLIDKQTIVARDEEKELAMDADTSFTREAAIQQLAEHDCQGLAVKLQDDEGRILAAALLGHGGKITQGVGTKNPIYISVGHDTSLDEAIKICTGLSLARIPEPVRQADLLGRELLRNNENKI